MLQMAVNGKQPRDTPRRFIRHPANVPIRVTDVPASTASHVTDVGYGGLSFTSAQPHSAGSEIEIRIPRVDASFSARAVVVWCHYVGPGYRIGVRFLDPDAAYRSRMVEQLCAIESYRREVREREGRELSGEEAAREWIERFGNRFPDPE